MSSTQSTDVSLNKFDTNRVATSSGKAVYVITGNMEDVEYKKVGKKYVSGRVKNDTYTLQDTGADFEESALLINWYQSFHPIGGTTDYDDCYIYGTPNKFIYDAKQKYNNCGVDTALNILSMGGLIDIFEPSDELVEQLKAPVTITYKNKYHDRKYVTVTPNVEVTSTEEDITLWAIQNDYANHSKDVKDYKTVEDIAVQDGGTYFHTHYREDGGRLYHDTLYSVKTILDKYNVNSQITEYNPLIQPSGERKEHEYTNAGQEVFTEAQEGGTHVKIADELFADYTVKYKYENDEYVESEDGTFILATDEITYIDISHKYTKGGYVENNNGTFIKTTAEEPSYLDTTAKFSYGAHQDAEGTYIQVGNNKYADTAGTKYENGYYGSGNGTYIRIDGNNEDFHDDNNFVDTKVRYTYNQEEHKYEESPDGPFIYYNDGYRDIETKYIYLDNAYVVEENPGADEILYVNLGNGTFANVNVMYLKGIHEDIAGSYIKAMDGSYVNIKTKYRDDGGGVYSEDPNGTYILVNGEYYDFNNRFSYGYYEDENGIFIQIDPENEDLSDETNFADTSIKYVYSPGSNGYTQSDIGTYIKINDNTYANTAIKYIFDEEVFVEDENGTYFSIDNGQSFINTEELYKLDTVAKTENYDIRYKSTVVDGFINLASGDVSIDDVEHGENDSITFVDVSFDEILENVKIYRADTGNYQVCSLADDGYDLVIRYSPTSYIRIKNFYDDPNNEEDKTTNITTIFDKNGDEMSIGAFVAMLSVGGYYNFNELKESNVHTYGTFLENLATLVREGRAIDLIGCAEALTGTKPEYPTINHAILVTGVAYKETAGEQARSVMDIQGFFVHDTGGWLEETVESQFIDCETLYNFVTAYEYGGSAEDYVEFYTDCETLATNAGYKSWADDLNLVGNGRRNTLKGNDSNNILRGGGDTDNLYGGRGSDSLYGDEGDDWLYGEQGNDMLYGGSGSDTYVFKESDGFQNDTITPGAGRDVIRFESIKLANLTYKHKGNDLVIYYENGHYNGDDFIPTGDTNSITIKDYYLAANELKNNVFYIDDVDSIALREADDSNHYYNLKDELQTAGVEYEYDETVSYNIPSVNNNEAITTGNKNDTINAGGGNDTITSGAGNDVIKAGSGANVINVTYGNNKIYGERAENKISFVYDNDTKTATGFNTIYNSKGKNFIELTTVTKNNLQFARNANDLVVIYDDRGSSITIQNYFILKGITSVKNIKLSNGNGGYEYLDLISEYEGFNQYKDYNGNNFVGLKNTTKLNLLVSNPNGTKGDDIIKSGGVITGGLGCDKMYGLTGFDVFKIGTLYDGADTVYETKTGISTIDFSDVVLDQEQGTYLTLDVANKTGFTTGYDRFVNGNKNYAYTKDKNDLIINYGQTLDVESMSSVRIANFFRRVNYYQITDHDGNNYNLNQATIYFEGVSDKTNRITGTAINDLIYGANLKDTLTGGAGNDTIVGGLGNDLMTGGVGSNVIEYYYGDGFDTISLTRNENLIINVHAKADANAIQHELLPENFSYAINKLGDLVISDAGYGQILTIKGFGLRDITGANGSVMLCFDDHTQIDLRNDIYLDCIDDFSINKKSYTGNWHSEYIDASDLASPFNAYNAGVTVNAGAGNDIIIGSDFNDVLRGGEGEDTLYGGKGKNTLDGGNGSDTYNLFGSLTANGLVSNINEEDIIKDSGRIGADTALIFKSDADLHLENINENEVLVSFDNLTISFNVARGQFAPKGAITILDSKNNNKATLTNINEIKATTDGITFYTYNYQGVAQQVGAWLAATPYADLNTALNYVTGNERDNILGYFANGWQVQQ